ncbi:hypothetical protein [Paenibacillus glycinis]|uniref:Uncharacterized protein n=1 Tax=Paenibacillus glycinis TaxID=2697035 RepID=A0ABW9XUM6_9BACL|nr:hypothetical protein [Paenibacillus glycinis]NBD26386.1 hypothetical protein [Paenibacillus glycinis]
MNQFGQQGFGGNMSGMNQQKNQYQPSGYVQSHYQGISRQPGGISAQSNTGPVISRVGYSAQNGGYGQSSAMHSSSSNGYGNAQPVLSHFGGSSINAGSQQPVISHYGGYQAQNMQRSQTMNAQQGRSSSMSNSQPVISHYGGYQAQNAQQSQPYQSSMTTMNQSQPVLSHFGGYQAQSAQNRGGYGMNGSNGYGATQFTSQAGNTPVLQNAGFSNQGPVISRHGYAANNQSATGFNNQQQF